MKTILFFVILFSAMELVAQSNSFKLPQQWDKSFVISLAHTGSRSGGSSQLTFTHDSCTYETTSLHDQPDKKSFPLSSKDRESILARMRELKIEKVKHTMSIAAQDDGWSTLLCFGTHCIEGGSSSVMNDKEQAAFQAASHYLEEFALKRK